MCCLFYSWYHQEFMICLSVCSYPPCTYNMRLYSQWHSVAPTHTVICTVILTAWQINGRDFVDWRKRFFCFWFFWRVEVTPNPVPCHFYFILLINHLFIHSPVVIRSRVIIMNLANILDEYCVTIIKIENKNYCV